MLALPACATFFEQAKKHAPAIVFIDELDALGKARSPGSFGGHDEKSRRSINC